MASGMPITFSNRDEFVGALEATRSYWMKVDREVTEDHEADEQAAFDAFQGQLRSLLSASYAEMKERIRFNREEAGEWDDEAEEYIAKKVVGVTFKPPTCPISKVATLDTILARLAITHQKSFKVEPNNGPFRDAYELLVGEADAMVNRTVC